MPKLEALMTEDQPVWTDEGSYPEHADLLEILRNAPRRPQVEIRVTVLNEKTGEVIENLIVEDAELWDHGYRQYFKVSRIMEAAERVAARVAYDDDNRRGQR